MDAPFHQTLAGHVDVEGVYNFVVAHVIELVNQFLLRPGDVCPRRLYFCHP